MADLRRRVLIVLADDLFVRNYVTTGSFRNVIDEHDVLFLAADSITQRPAVTDLDGFRGWISTSAALTRLHYFLFNVLMWRNRGRSTSFRFRIRRHLGVEHLHHARHARSVRERALAFARFVGRILRPDVWPIVVLGSPPLSALFVPAITRLMPVNRQFARAVDAAAPDLIVFPSSAYDPIGNDVARIGRAQHIPTLFLVDNWDNLSSKSIFWAIPDRLGVWGPQSVEHAVRIQRIQPTRVEPLGTPRFDTYFHLRDTEVDRPFDFTYALFVGCALPFDEVEALHILDDAIERERSEFGDLRLVYRPHPWRQPRLREAPFVASDFRHVVLDPQLEGYEDRSTRKIPALDYYGPLLRHAEVVVAPLTTMLIEALIFGKPTVAIVYDDGVHFASPSRAFAAYEHFRGLEDIPSVRLCRERRDLSASFRDAWRARGAIDRAAADDAVRPFLHLDERPYAQRLSDLVQKTLDETAVR